VASPTSCSDSSGVCSMPVTDHHLFSDCCGLFLSIPAPRLSYCGSETVVRACP
jgi:hypothetical protein